MTHFLSADKSLLFGIICWSLWKTHNAKVFANTSDSTVTIAIRACAWSWTVEEAMNREDKTTGEENVRQILDISWDPGPHGWVTINIDDVVIRETGRAEAGGLIRNELGHCTEDFSMNIEFCSITHIELKGAIMGLHIAWDRDLKKVELQVDAMSVLHLVEIEGDPRHQHAM
ncbi:Putative ribonuclease H protein At1g65750 [Linum perenne]